MNSTTMTTWSEGSGGFPSSVNLQLLEVLVAVAVFLAIRSLAHGRRQGLAVWPVLGMLPSLLLGMKTNLYEWLCEVLIRQNGTFRFKGPWLSSMNCVVTADPRNVEYMLKSKFSSFPKGEYFRSTVADLLGSGIFNADGETWQRQRKVASIEFHSASFRKLSSESLHALVDSRLIPVLEDSVEKGGCIDLQEVLLGLTFDNVCMMAFGVDPGCLGVGVGEIPFARAFEEATEATLLRFVMPTCVWKGMRWLKVGPERRLAESIKGVDQFASHVIRTRRAELQASEDDTTRSDLLSVFMMMKKDIEGEGDVQGAYYSDAFLKDICVNFILAGRDTSSVALTWLFWLLNAHPEVEDRILQEIRTLKDPKRMDYLQAAISETLRLYPSVPVDHKEVIEDEVFPDGTKLKKGTKVVYAIYAMGRMESIWGKDCREFKPERWLRDGRYMTESAYKFTAFNGGPRLCLGRDFAYYQMKFVAASIISRYHVEVVKGHPVTPKLALTMYMKHGLRVRLIKR